MILKFKYVAILLYLKTVQNSNKELAVSLACWESVNDRQVVVCLSTNGERASLIRLRKTTVLLHDCNAPGISKELLHSLNL